MKRLFALLLAAMMLLSLMTGCSEENVNPDADVNANRFTFPTLPTVGIRYPMDDDTTEETLPQLDPIVMPQLSVVQNQNSLNHKDMKYVMIYNPDIIVMNSQYVYAGSTGTFGNQIEPYMNRSDSLNDDKLMVTPDQLNPVIDAKINTEGDRAGFAPTYRVGNTKQFYSYPDTSLDEPRIVRSFNCRYVGENCYIWVYNNTISDEVAQKYGKEFDENIYPQSVERFGLPRYAEEGGKIHLLYYPMQQEFAGCFCMLDLYASYEFTPDVIAQYGINTDHAIFHMNALYASNPAAELGMTTTMAHEFQHLLLGSASLCRPDYLSAPAWINEAMSTYIEPVLYPEYAAQQQNYVRLHSDSLIRHGQSLYNFNNLTPTNEYEFSTYDHVYLFANYLERLAGDKVFSEIHRYWRTSYSPTMSDMETIAKCVPTTVYQQVMDSIGPGYKSFVLQSDEFMSKLVLQFYLDMLDRDDTDPVAFATLDPGMLIYDEVNGANVQPGGRVIVALRGSTYQIPEDATAGLVYIGLDANFQPVTPILYH